MAKILRSQLFVSRLSSYTTNERLKGLFAPFGVVKEARLVKDPKTQRPKGFGFVTFESKGDADKALKAMDGRVNKNLPKEKNPSFYEMMEWMNFWLLVIVDGRLIFVEVAKAEHSTF